jgi:TPP-dependent 2-oxoacid decarboxylase
MDDSTNRSNRSIGQYLIQRLQDYGIEDVFGIPGDYVLAFTATWNAVRSMLSVVRAKIVLDSLLTHTRD